MKKLQETVDEINEKAGKEIAFSGKGRDGEDVPAEPTGMLPLDVAIGIGGLPKGRIIEVHGLQSSGKTSLCLAVISQFQKKGIPCAYVDAEYSFSYDHAKNMGVDTDDLLMIQPDCGEEAFEVMEKLVREKSAGLIVVDSVSALVPKPEAEADFGKPTMGVQARLMASGLRKLIGPVAKNGAIIIFINQLRMNIMGGQYDPYTLPGGMSLRFYASVMLELHRDKAIMKGEELMGYNINIRIKKNKVGKPNERCSVQLMFKDGFNAEADLLSMGEKAGFVTKEKTTYFLGETRLGVGQNKARSFLQENPSIAEELRSKLSPCA